MIEKFPALNTFYRVMRDNRRNMQPRRTPMGFLFQGNSVMETGQFEPLETALVKRLAKEVDIVVNVGANVGYYCCLALHAGRKVIAFEPLAANLHHLLRNLKINGWDKGNEIFPIALSDTPGLVEIYGGGTGASLIKGWANVPLSYSTFVPTHRADDVLCHRLSGLRCLFIVDIEGAEARFLRGARRLLDQQPYAIWMMEITVAEHQPKNVTINPSLEETFALFFTHGYQAWAIAKPIRRVLPAEITAVTQSHVDTLGTHNFLFIHQSESPRFIDIDLSI
jgi:FkbM family methyltransferase